MISDDHDNRLLDLVDVRMNISRFWLFYWWLVIDTAYSSNATIVWVPLSFSQRTCFHCSNSIKSIVTAQCDLLVRRLWVHPPFSRLTYLCSSYSIDEIVVRTVSLSMPTITCRFHRCSNAHFSLLVILLIWHHHWHYLIFDDDGSVWVSSSLFHNKIVCVLDILSMTSSLTVCDIRSWQSSARFHLCSNE